MKRPERIPKYLTIPQQERILEALSTDRTLLGRRDYACIATMLFTGVRVSELVTLRVADVDLEAGTLRVIGKGNKERILPIAPRLRPILLDYLDNGRVAK